MAASIDAGKFAQRLRAALEESETFVRSMPAGKEGVLFLKDGKPVQPDPENLGACVEHAGLLRGHWPSSSEITSSMLECYGKPSL